MYKDYRYINAGENEYYRWGKKAQEKLAKHLTPNAQGWYNIPVDGGKYWTFGTSTGKYGEFAKWEETIFSVNSYGNLYAKADTEKGEKFVAMIEKLLDTMKNKKNNDYEEYDDDEE